MLSTLLRTLSFNSMNLGQLKTEYNKLDFIDRKVLQWTIKHSPASIPSWIEYTVKSYQSSKGIDINAQLLLNEVIDNKFEM